MGKIESATQWMVNLANDNSHGYDQTNRWGPDYDCSSAVITAWQQAGVPVKSNGASYTGNMLQAFLKSGFSNVTSLINLSTGTGLKYGDVLLNVAKHTAMSLGNGQIVHASINELGTTTGGQTGDQTGAEICIRGYYNKPWDYVLRYTAEPSSSGEWIQAADGRWWYRHSDGSYKKNDWEFINGEWYYFDAEGWMKTGWIPWKGLWYYCDSSGKMLTNCWVENKYYVGGDGSMLVNTMTPDGYVVGANGEWDGREKWVTRLQRALKAAGYNPGTIDGEAGPNTLNACPTLQYNSQGAIVSLVQEKLANYFHIGVAGGIDGSFGEGTESAVKELQRQYHLDMDGVVGRATWTVLLQL